MKIYSVVISIREYIESSNIDQEVDVTLGLFSTKEAAIAAGEILMSNGDRYNEGYFVHETELDAPIDDSNLPWH